MDETEIRQTERKDREEKEKKNKQFLINKFQKIAHQPFLSNGVVIVCSTHYVQCTVDAVHQINTEIVWFFMAKDCIERTVV